MWLFKLPLFSCFNSATRAVQLLLPGVRKGFIKGEALRLLRTNSSKAKFEENIALLKQRPRHRGYPDNISNVTLPEVNLSERMSALHNKWSWYQLYSFQLNEREGYQRLSLSKASARSLKVLMNIEVLWDGVHGSKSSSKKTWKSDRLQIQLQR